MNSGELAAEPTGHKDEIADVEAEQFAALNSLGEVLVNRFDAAGEKFGLGGTGAEDVFFGLRQGGEAKLLDVSAVLNVPMAERWDGNCKVLGNFRQRPALGAKFDEFVFGFVGVHKLQILDCFGFSVA